MSHLHFPSASPQQIRWPKHSAGILALGQTVLAAEQALPPAQQYPLLAQLPSRVDALISFATTAGLAEADRTAQADAEKTAFDAANSRCALFLCRISRAASDPSLRPVEFPLPS